MCDNRSTVIALDSDEVYCQWWKCSECSCSDIMSHHRYCPVCGNNIDWDNSVC